MSWKKKTAYRMPTWPCCPLDLGEKVILSIVKISLIISLHCWRLGGWGLYQCHVIAFLQAINNILHKYQSFLSITSSLTIPKYRTLTSIARSYPRTFFKIKNILLKYLNFGTYPENVRVIGIHLSTLSPTLLLWLRWFTFNLGSDEEADLIFPAKFSPPLGACCWMLCSPN